MRNFSSREGTLSFVADAFSKEADTTETASLLFLTEAEAKAAYRRLEKLFDEKGLSKEQLFYIDRNSNYFHTGLTVTTFYLAKGLEFETVYAVTAKDRTDELTNQARYIMATRAMHRLYICEECKGENE